MKRWKAVTESKDHRNNRDWSHEWQTTVVDGHGLVAMLTSNGDACVLCIHGTDKRLSTTSSDGLSHRHSTQVERTIYVWDRTTTGSSLINGRRLLRGWPSTALEIPSSAENIRVEVSECRWSSPMHDHRHKHDWCPVSFDGDLAFAGTERSTLRSSCWCRTDAMMLGIIEDYQQWVDCASLQSPLADASVQVCVGRCSPGHLIEVRRRSTSVAWSTEKQWLTSGILIRQSILTQWYMISELEASKSDWTVRICRDVRMESHAVSRDGPDAGIERSFGLSFSNLEWMTTSLSVAGRIGREWSRERESFREALELIRRQANTLNECVERFVADDHDKDHWTALSRHHRNSHDAMVTGSAVDWSARSDRWMLEIGRGHGDSRTPR